MGVLAQTHSDSFCASLTFLYPLWCPIPLPDLQKQTLLKAVASFFSSLPSVCLWITHFQSFNYGLFVLDSQNPPLVCDLFFFFFSDFHIVILNFPLNSSIRLTITYLGFPGSTTGKEPICQCRRCKRCRLDLWVRKIPQRRTRQTSPVFLPVKCHGQRSLGSQRVGHDWAHYTPLLLIHPNSLFSFLSPDLCIHFWAIFNRSRSFYSEFSSVSYCLLSQGENFEWLPTFALCSHLISHQVLPLTLGAFYLPLPWVSRGYILRFFPHSWGSILPSSSVKLLHCGFFPLWLGGPDAHPVRAPGSLPLLRLLHHCSPV